MRWRPTVSTTPSRCAMPTNMAHRASAARRCIRCWTCWWRREDPQAVLEVIAAPATRIVSLTVTEKGYHHDPATGALKRDDPGIVHDLAHPRSPRTTLGFLVHGLALRHARGLGPVTLLSCDNLPATAPRCAAWCWPSQRRCDAALADWIASACRFPNAHGRPHRAAHHRRRPRAHRRALGCATPGRWWPSRSSTGSIEDHFAAGRPDWTALRRRALRRAGRAFREAQAAHGQRQPLDHRLPRRGGRLGHGGPRHPRSRRCGGLVDAHDARGDRADPARPRRPGPRRLPHPAHRTFRQPGAGAPDAADRHGRLAEDPAALARHGARPSRGRCVHRPARARRGRVAALPARRRRGRAGLRGQRPAGGRAVCAAGARRDDAGRDSACGHAVRFAPVFGTLGEDARFVEAVARHTASLRERGVLATLEALA